MRHFKKKIKAKSQTNPGGGSNYNSNNDNGNTTTNNNNDAGLPALVVGVAGMMEGRAGQSQRLTRFVT